VLHHGSLVRTVLEGQLPGKKGRGRPKEMLLSWLLETNIKDIDYSQLKNGQDVVDEYVNLAIRADHSSNNSPGVGVT